MYKMQQLGTIQRVFLLYKGEAGEGAQSVLAGGQAPNLGPASARVSVSALAASSPDCRDFDHFLLQLMPSRFEALWVAPSLRPSPCTSYSLPTVNCVFSLI